MGMYTELHFNAQLRRDLPKQVLDTLAFMVDKVPDKPVELPDHPLFATRSWGSMLVCDSSYFPAETSTHLVLEAGRWSLSVRSNFKDYDDEVKHFLDWVRSYLNADGECLGFYRYEEDDHPTLIYAAGDRKATDTIAIPYAAHRTTHTLTPREAAVVIVVAFAYVEEAHAAPEPYSAAPTPFNPDWLCATGMLEAARDGEGYHEHVTSLLGEDAIDYPDVTSCPA